MNRRIVLLLIVIGAGCRLGSVERDAAASAAQRDAASVEGGGRARAPGEPIPESVLREIAALDDSVARDTVGPEAPQALWRLATRYAGVSPFFGEDTVAVFRSLNRLAFTSWEGTWEYNGLQYSLLAWRYPNHALADTAAWEISNLRQVYECEGSVACYISAELTPAREFLERFPASRLAPAAVRRANAALDSTFAVGRRLQANELWEVDSAAIRSLIAGYDSTARELPPALRASAMPTIERWRTAWGSPSPDSATLFVDGPVVAFESENCGVRFRHPAQWRVVVQPARAAGWCALQVSPPTSVVMSNPDDLVDSTTIVIRTHAIDVDRAISPREFRRIDGQWSSVNDDQTTEPLESVYLGAAWHGLRNDRYQPCVGSSVRAECKTTLVVVGTSHRAARIVAGSRAVGVLELILRTLTFY